MTYLALVVWAVALVALIAAQWRLDYRTPAATDPTPTRKTPHDPNIIPARRSHRFHPVHPHHLQRYRARDLPTRHRERLAQMHTNDDHLIPVYHDHDDNGYYRLDINNRATHYVVPVDYFLANFVERPRHHTHDNYQPTEFHDHDGSAPEHVHATYGTVTYCTIIRPDAGG